MRTKKPGYRSGCDVDPGPGKRRPHPTDQRRSGGVIMRRGGPVEELVLNKEPEEREPEIWLTVVDGRFVVSER